MVSTEASLGTRRCHGRQHIHREPARRHAATKRAASRPQQRGPAERNGVVRHPILVIFCMAAVESSQWCTHDSGPRERARNIWAVHHTVQAVQWHEVCPLGVRGHVPSAESSPSLDTCKHPSRAARPWQPSEACSRTRLSVARWNQTLKGKSPMPVRSSGPPPGRTPRPGRVRVPGPDRNTPLFRA